MKKLVYTLSLLILLGACKSIDKLVEKGEYDQAIKLAVKKLQGKKNKKTKYVKGLERAFEKITARDLNQVERLKARSNDRHWEDIYRIYNKINDRQEVINPLIPLISEDGYYAKFKFLNTSSLEKEAAMNASAYYYKNGKNALVDARNGNKKAAISAYNTLSKIEKYYSNYKNTNELINEAYELGQTHILVQLENNSNRILPRKFESDLFSFGLRKLDTKWNKFYSKDNNDRNEFDVSAIYHLEYIDASPEREIVKYHEETKEISDGWDYVLDNNGNVMKDSSGNDIKLERFVTISAEVADIILEKSVGIDGHLKIIDHNYDKLILNKPLSGEAVFDEHFSTFKGDKHALSAKTKKRIRNGHTNFPSDEELLLITAHELKTEIKRELRRLFN